MPHGYMRHTLIRRNSGITSKRCLEGTLLDVHDLGAHGEKHLGGLVLREEVREVVDGADVQEDDLPFLDHHDSLCSMLRNVGHCRGASYASVLVLCVCSLWTRRRNVYVTDDMTRVSSRDSHSHHVLSIVA